MTERYNQVMQFLYDHANNIDTKSTELHEIAIMMRNCLDELADTKTKLDIAVDALKEIIDWDKCVALRANNFVDIAEKAIQKIQKEAEK